MAIFRSVAALGLAICAMQAVSSRPADGPAPVTHTVIIEGARFDPADLTVKPGETVVWINRDAFPHTVTSKAGGFDSRQIPSGRSWRVRIDKAGAFPYLCTLHTTMTATLRVK